MSNTNAGRTKLGEINFGSGGLRVSNTSGTIDNTKPGTDLSEVIFYNSHITLFLIIILITINLKILLN